jgi:DMSO/TMAO reductase YedYZ molybdopterin-dependent catalytic subunit
MTKNLFYLLVYILLIVVVILSSCGSKTIQTTTTTTSTEIASSQTEQATTRTFVDLSYLIFSNPHDVDNSDLPITPIEELHETGFYRQEVDINNYRLTIGGLVDRPISLTYETIMQYPMTTATALLICPEVFVDNAKWTGVSVAILLAESGIKPEATGVTFYALDGYHISLSLKEALNDGVFLAYAVNDQILPKAHGYPLRLVATGEYGASWLKWVERIEVN